MTQTLYSLRTEIDASGATRYRITKFLDGEVESSYHTSREACDCPAGVRPTCRHRQMLPQMLNASIVNTHWFYEHETAKIVDFEGTPRSRYAMEPEEPPEAMRAPEGEALRQPSASPSAEPAPAQPHSEVVITEGFDPSIGGSNPPAVAIPDLPANHSAQSGDVIGRLTSRAHPWRRL